MSRGNSGDKITGHIPEDQIDKVKIKQLENRIQELEGRLFRIRKLIEEIYPMFKLIQAPEDNMVQWLIRS